MEKPPLLIVSLLSFFSTQLTFFFLLFKYKGTKVTSLLKICPWLLTLCRTQAQCLGVAHQPLQGLLILSLDSGLRFSSLVPLSHKAFFPLLTFMILMLQVLPPLQFQSPHKCHSLCLEFSSLKWSARQPQLILQGFT